MYEQGNAAYYATWTDERLNVVLRSQAQRAHPMTFDRTVLASFALIAMLKLMPLLHGEAEDEED